MTTKALAPYDAFKETLKMESVIQQFKDVQAGPEFIASLLSLVAQDKKLQNCTHRSILIAAMKAAVLKLPIEKALGLAHIVPFGKEAEFIIDYKGILNLCARTNQYARIHATEIYEGQDIKQNWATGETVVSGEPISDKIIGYLAHFKLLSGLENTMYWPRDRVMEHAKKYSRAYQYALKNGRKDTPWIDNEVDMGKKTMLKQVLKGAPKSIEWQNGSPEIMALSDEENIQVPTFDNIVEGESRDYDHPDLDEYPDELIDPGDLDDWTEPLIEAGLFQHSNHAQNAFRKSDIVFHTDEERMTWAKLYRANRDVTGDSDKAAAFADAGEIANE